MHFVTMGNAVLQSNDTRRSRSGGAYWRAGEILIVLLCTTGYFIAAARHGPSKAPADSNKFVYTRPAQIFEPLRNAAVRDPSLTRKPAEKTSVLHSRPRLLHFAGRPK